jgi:tetratricopeptide (TPR) repeat protein
LKIKAFKREFVDEDLEGALDEYRMMIELYPDLNSAYNNSGVILRSLGRYDEAVAMFEKSAEIAAIKHFTLGNLWWTHLNFRKDPCAAEEVAERLISLAHDIAIHFQYYGYSLSAQARFEEASQAFRQALSLDPQNRWALPNLAHVLLASGNAVAAVPIYREVRELVSRGRIHGTYDWSSVSLAIALIEAGDSEAAKEAAAEGKKDKLEKLKGAVPDTRGLILLGQLEAVIGQNGEAKQYLDRALKRGIKEPDIILCLAQLYALMGQDELAIETIKRALDSGYSDYYFPLITPAFQSIRNDPRFRALFGLNEQ